MTTAKRDECAVPRAESPPARRNSPSLRAQEPRATQLFVVFRLHRHRVRLTTA